MKELALQLVSILSPIFLALLTWLAAKSASLITARAKNELLRGVLIRLNDAVFGIVREVQQTYVDAIKRLSSDGKLTPEEADQAKREAMDKLKSHLGTKGLVELAAVLGLNEQGVAGLLSSKIEASLHEMKLQQTAVAKSPDKTVVTNPL